jgi:hypothetical protein
MLTPLLWTRQSDVIGALGLAINAAAERDGQVEVCDRISELLTCARSIWQTSADGGGDDSRPPSWRRTLQLIHLADIEALTAPRE